MNPLDRPAPLTETIVGRSRAALGRPAVRHLPVTLLGGLYLYASGIKAARSPLWFDEILTYHVASLDGPRAIIEALLAKMDNHPPLDYLARHVSMSLLGMSEFALRLPSVIGLLVAALSLYLFVLRRTSVLPALVAFSFPFVTMALRYSYDGRAYSFLFASMCLTLLAWQLATEKPTALRLVFVTVCLSLGPHSHYYGVLNYLPIAVGEAWRWRERREISWYMVACFAASVLVVAVLIPFAIHSRDFAGHFWTNFGPGLVAFIYVDVLKNAIPAAVAALVGCTLAIFFIRRRSDPRVLGVSIPQHEAAAALVLCLVPVTTYLLAELVTHAYTDKYLINTIVGIALALAYLAASLRKWRPDCALIVALSFSLWAAGTLVYSIRYTPSRPYTVPAEDLAMIEAAAQPVAVFDAHHFLKMHYYLPPHLRDKVYHLTDAKLSIENTGHNTNDVVFANLKPFVRLNVLNLCDFTKMYRRFLVLMVKPSWVVPRLVKDNATVAIAKQSLKGHAWLSVSLDGPSGC